jgi:hypothetical protein
MLAPPLSEGAVQVRATEALPNVPASAVGALAVVRGVAGAEVADQAPCSSFTAATRKTYGVPFVRPITVALVLVETPSEAVVQLEPASELY